MNTTDKIYYSSPVWLQNILVSLYGWKLAKERNSVASRAKLTELKSSEFCDSNSQDKLVDSLLLKTLTHAKSTSYYSEALSELNTGNSENPFETLQKIKITPKEEVRKSPLDFVSKLATNPNIVLHTSGTTGTPLSVFTNKECRSAHYAFFARLRQNYGLTKKSKRATFLGRIIQKSDINHPPFWRSDIFQNNRLYSSYHLSNDNLEHYINDLRRYQPDEYFGYPSSIYQLSRFINENNLPALDCKLVMTTAENLLHYQRVEIEKAFNGQLVNQYGCTEMAFFCNECEHGIMHSNPEHAYLEVLRDDGTIAAEGTGSLLATGLVNNAMPLLRYAIGDRVTIRSSHNCECKRSWPVIEAIEGRIEDTLYKKDGTPVGRLDPIFKGDFDLKGACVVQEATGDIELMVIPGPSFNESTKNSLIYELKKRFGADLNVSLSLVNSLPKTKAGKQKAIIGKFKGRS